MSADLALDPLPSRRKPRWPAIALIALCAAALAGVGYGRATLADIAAALPRTPDIATMPVSTVVVDRNGEGAAAVAAEIVEAHGEGSAIAWTVDLADPAAITALVDEVVERLGPVDILVNNAGIALPAVIDGDGEAYEMAWEATLAVNLTAYERLARACMPHLVRNGEGRIVNIASTEGLGASRFNSPFT